jgi:hypothetical protein
MTLENILAELASGRLDKDMAALSAAIDARRSQMEQASFGLGDKVVFNNQCGTRYIVGHTATVTGMKRTKVVVKLDKPAGRFVRYVNGEAVSPEITVPVSIIDHAA